MFRLDVHLHIEIRGMIGATDPSARSLHATGSIQHDTNHLQKNLQKVKRIVWELKLTRNGRDRQPHNMRSIKMETLVFDECSVTSL